MRIQCLLDTNSVLKRYFNLAGSDFINFLFDKSPTAMLNITSVDVAGTLALFYKFQREGAITSYDGLEAYKSMFFRDIKNSKIKIYDFAREHLLDFTVYEKITHVPPPVLRTGREYIGEFGGYVERLQDTAGVCDIAMLMVAREMHFLSGGNCYLITDRGHVEAAARVLAIRTLNPEKTTMADIPLSLDMRKHKRLDTRLKVICDSPKNGAACYGSALSLNVSAGGICVTQPATKLHKHERVSLAVLRLSEALFERMAGTVVWADKESAGVAFDEPAELNSLLS